MNTASATHDCGKYDTKMIRPEQQREYFAALSGSARGQSPLPFRDYEKQNLRNQNYQKQYGADPHPFSWNSYQ